MKVLVNKTLNYICMNWYDKSKREAQEVSASPPPYGDNAAIQNREDLVPSRLRKKKKKCNNNKCKIK